MPGIGRSRAHARPNGLRRRELLAAGASLLAGLAGCGGGGDGAAAPSAADRADGTARPARSALVTNLSGQDVRFDLRINDHWCVANESGLLGELVLRADIGSRDRAIAVALWQLLMRDTLHFEPLTSERWAHSPVLLLNSIGFGFCDDVAAALASLARAAGLDARVWTLAGHVVCEIRVDGRWEVYDPDLRAVYFADDGRPAGVEQIVADPSLVTAPRLAQLPDWARSLGLETTASAADGRYSALVASIYASGDDNLVSAWYDTVPGLAEPGGPALALPARARLHIGLREAETAQTMYGAAVPRQGVLMVELPPSSAGSMNLPFVPFQVRGSGHVVVDAQPFTAGDPSLLPHVVARDRPVRDIAWAAGPESLKVEFLFNPTRFALDGLRRVEVRGAADGALAVDLLASAVPL